MNWETHLRLRHVRCFLEVARLESVSQAAERLHLTQPAVSRTIGELEQMLGMRLFDRVGRGLQLNEAGRIFQAHAAASMQALTYGHDRLNGRAANPARLSVGVLPTAAANLVPNAALAFHAQMPEAQLHILTGPNWMLFNQLRDGVLDLVVGRMPESEVATGVIFEQLYIEDVVLVCRPEHPILSRERPQAAIADHPLILPPKGAVISPTVERYLASLGFAQIRAPFETVALQVGRKLVQRSDALWFISRGVVADELDLGLLVAVDLASPLLSGPVGISTLRAAHGNEARALFADCLRRL
ncbi:MAG: pca operon transcription factor PcaQ [Neomegalonema sp.]|nr:pca operon transcription factor PcaQ [Neomegalonema sp.]